MPEARLPRDDVMMDAEAARCGWQVRRFRSELPAPSSLPPTLALMEEDLEAWLVDIDIPVGTPFLISPLFEYDVTLNSFFYSAYMVGNSRTTQLGYARDLAAFLTFLWCCRGGRSWRDADEADHVAYLVWRRKDRSGPPSE
ncbi:hypothetical protein [Micromonospora sp. URMC 103]|uniref:hypothetical protein n=1 Tax=Micromonospora sp. URMC 103 TaxID=3423406 RepID=UPI003F1AE6BD